MTLFGVIWALVIIYCLQKKSIEYMFFATVFFMTFQCSNVLYINNGAGVGPQVLTSLCFIFKVLILNKAKMPRVRKDESWLTILCLSVLMFAVIYSSVINQIFFEKILLILQVAVYATCFVLMRRVARYIDKELLYVVTRNIIIFVVCVGIVQWFITSVMPGGRIILKELFYNDDSIDVYFNNNILSHNKRIYSTFMEPSYFAAYAVGAFFYILSYKNKIKNNALLLSLLALMIVVSLSSTAYGAYIITGLLFIVCNKDIKWKWKTFLIAIVLILSVVFGLSFYNILDEVILSKSLSSSAITRAGWNREAYKAFLSSPLFGVGYKAIRGSSIYYSLLGQIGAVGVIAFILFNICIVWRCIFRITISNNYSEGYYGTMYAVIASFVCLLIACPDLDLCSYWLWLYLFAVYDGQELVIYKTRKKIKYRYGIQNRIRYYGGY